MFSHFLHSFSKNFRSKVFTYLCLEDPKSWRPVLGREYKCDKDFEMDINKHYQEKIDSIRK